MSGKSVIIVLVSLSVMVGAATAQEPAPPGIISWSNSNTADKKTVFMVQSGKKVTFTVKAGGAEKYVWMVNGVIQQGADAASFKWTTPREKGMWKICVKTTNKAREEWAQKDFAVWKERFKPRVGRRGRKIDFSGFIQQVMDLNVYPFESRKEWIVSTFLTKVKPGESIQKAIDSLPPEGGIVELAPGLHDVRKTIYIKISNVVVCGTRKSEIKAHDGVRRVFVIPNEKPKADNTGATFGKLENLVFRGFKVTGSVTKRIRGGCVILAWNVDNLVVEGIENSSYLGRVVVTNSFSHGDAKVRSKNVIVRNCIGHHSAMSLYHSNPVYVVNNTFKDFPQTTWGLHIDTGNRDIHVVGNYVENCGVNAALCMDLGGPYNVRDNEVVNASQRGIYMEASVHDAIVINNTVRGARKYGKFCAGIMAKPQSPINNVLIMNNRIYNCDGFGIYMTDIGYNVSPGSNADIINNVIYNNSGDGIVLRSKFYSFLNVSNNIIANNKGYGINGIKGKITLGHNNVWNNTKGNYNGCSAGTGDISVAPLFADPSKADFHLKSKVGRWNPKTKKWVKDDVNSPCIDAGDPKADFSREPAPNGGRINIGAYGNTKEASKSRPEQTKAQPTVKLWDVGEKHPWHNGFRPYAKQELWKQVPYGETSHEFRGDAVIENDFFFLYFYRTITLHGKVNGKPRIWRNVLYKVYVDPSGRRNYGHTPPKYFKVLKNTHQEIIVEHQGGKSVTTTYRFPRNKPWFEVRGLKNATEQGIHGKVRMALAPVEGGNDFVVDSLRDPSGRPNAPGGKMIISFYENRTNPCMWVFTWTAPFKEAAPWFLNDSGPKGDTMWCSPGKWGGLDIPRKWPGCITSSWAKFGKDGGVVLGALVYPNNWHRQQVDKPIKKGQTYTSRWKPPYPGRWRMTVRVAEKKYDQGFKYDGKTKFPAKYFSKDVSDGNFTFKSPIDGVLDYVIMYMYDRTKDTPKDIQTPMDQYRWTKKNKQEKEK